MVLIKYVMTMFQIMTPNNHHKTFMYFAYGSNLLSKRIHIKNPSAKRLGIGKLDVSSIYLTNFNSKYLILIHILISINLGLSLRLYDPNGFLERCCSNYCWRFGLWGLGRYLGDRHVAYGKSWQVSFCHAFVSKLLYKINSIYRQEGVHLFVYKPLTKDIETLHGDLVSCRVYQQSTNPEDGLPIADIPLNRQPSQTYLQTIQDGAIESHLPEEYLAFLNRIPNNGHNASSSLMDSLNR